MPCFQWNGGIKQGMGPFGTGLERICAVVAGSTSAEMAGQVRLALRETSTVELRLDWLGSDRERVRFLRWLRKFNLSRKGKAPAATFLATCRRKVGGGKLDGDANRELYWLIHAREAGCSWCDIEVETMRELPDESAREYAVPPNVMLSIHDFERTPKLHRVVKPAAHGELNAIKIAARARTIEDSLRLLKVARNSKNFVAIPMGEIGLPGRILSLRQGSA